MAFSTNLEFVKSGGFGGVVESVPHRIASGILADVVRWGEGPAVGTVEGIQPQNTPPHVVSIRNNLVFTHH